MKRKGSSLIIAAVSLILAGCSTVTIDNTMADGTHCVASRRALFMNATAIQGEACGGSVGAVNSASDQAIVQLVTALVNSSFGKAAVK